MGADGSVLRFLLSLRAFCRRNCIPRIGCLASCGTAGQVSPLAEPDAQGKLSRHCRHFPPAGYTSHFPISHGYFAPPKKCKKSLALAQLLAPSRVTDVLFALYLRILRSETRPLVQQRYITPSNRPQHSASTWGAVHGIGGAPMPTWSSYRLGNSTTTKVGQFISVPGMGNPDTGVVPCQHRTISTLDMAMAGSMIRDGWSASSAPGSYPTSLPTSAS